MAIAFGTIGAKASGTTTVALPVPASRAAGDGLVAGRAIWLGTATAIDEFGWTPAGNISGGTGTAADAHTTRARGDFRTCVGNEAATLTFDQGSSPSTIGAMARYTKDAAKVWSVASATGDDNNHAADRSVTTGTLDLAPGDMLVAIAPVDTDAALTITAPTFTASGITFGTVNRRTPATAGSTTGTDGNIELFDALVSSGSGTVAVTFAFTTATSQCGPVVIIRLREIDPPPPSFPGLIDGVEPETHSRMNVIQNGASGPLYRVNESYLANPAGFQNQPMMFKSTDGGMTWTEQDAANRPGRALGNIVDLESFAMVADHDGHSIVMLNQASTRVSFMRFRMASHPTNPDTWESNTREDSDSGTPTPDPQFVSITAPGSQAYDWMFWQGAGGRFASRTNSTTFGTETAVETASDHYPATVLGESDATWIFYKRAGTPNRLRCRSLSAAGSLGTAFQVDTNGLSAHADHVVPFAAPVYYDNAGDEVISILFTNTSQQPTVVDVVNGTPGSEQVIDTTAVAADEGTTTSLQPIMALAVDGTTLHAVWVQTTTWDVMHSSRPHGGSWSTPDVLFDGAGTEVAYATAAIVEHSGTKYIGYTYDLGPHADDDSNTFYNRLQLSAPVNVNVDPAVLSLSGTDITAAGTGNATTTVDVAALALTGQTPTAAGTGSATAPADIATLLLTGIDPAAIGSGAADIAADPAALTLVGVDVAAATGAGVVSIDVDPATLTLSGAADSALTGTGSAPVTLDAATLVLSGQDATAAGTGAGGATADPAVLTLTGVDITTAGTGAATQPVEVAVLALSGIDVVVGAGTVNVIVDPAVLTLTGINPDAAGSSQAAVIVDVATLTITGLTPTVLGTGAAAVIADTATLTLTGADLAAAGSGIATMAADSAVLTLSGVEVIAIGYVPDANPVTLTVRDTGHTTTVQTRGTTGTFRTPRAHATTKENT